MSNSAKEVIQHHTKGINQWNEELILSFYTSAVEYLNKVKEWCPYSYLDIFPLLSKKMINALKGYLLSMCSLGKLTDIEAFKLNVYTRIIYEATEIYVTNETRLPTNDVTKQLISIIFNEERGHLK